MRDGHSPIFSFDGTTLLIDGVPQFDLKGETGNGIASVQLTSTEGLVKTYTITFTDATTTTFTVTDGVAAVVQEKGGNTSIVMSQKAVTDELDQLAGDVEGTIEMPIAHALSQLKEEIDSLRILIEEGRINRMQIETLDVISEIRINGSPLIYVRDSAPSFSPDQVPQFYIDTSAGRFYAAKGTGSANDWF